MDGMGRTTQIYTFYKYGWPTTQEQSPGFDTSLLENPKNTLHLPLEKHPKFSPDLVVPP